MENHMGYASDMEIISSDIMDKVLTEFEAFDYSSFNKQDVYTALNKDSLSFYDYGALLSQCAGDFLEEMAVRAKQETVKHFGNSVAMFTPLYISNYCTNQCLYCGFNCMNKITRGKLSYDEIDSELEAIAKTGLKEILLLTGESRVKSDVTYIGEAVRLAKKYFDTIGIEIYPLNTKEYAYLHHCGVDFISVYQETYDTNVYDRNHPTGPKRRFPYRFYSQERAILGGMRGVAFGALLGLSDFRKDAYAVGIHAYLLQQKYPHAEISFSVPRLRPYINNNERKPCGVSERDLLQVMLAYRIFMPYASITISTRERAGFRDNVVGLCATKISAGVKVGIGGHETEQKGDEQFEISDDRSVSEIHNILLSKGLQPVYTDYIPLM